MDFLVSLEQTAFAAWVRESSSLWAYPTILILHTIGLAFLVGINAAIDLRIAGFGSGEPIAPMEKLFPVMWIGFWINAVSGLALTIADATTKVIAAISLFLWIGVMYWVRMLPFIGLLSRTGARTLLANNEERIWKS